MGGNKRKRQPDAIAAAGATTEIPTMPTKEGQQVAYQGCAITAKVAQKKFVVRIPRRCSTSGKEYSVDRVFGENKALGDNPYAQRS